MERSEQWRATAGLAAVGVLLAAIIGWNSELTHTHRVIAILLIGGAVFIIGVLNLRATFDQRTRHFFDLSIAVGAAILVSLGKLSLYVFAGQRNQNLRDAGMFILLAVCNYLVLRQSQRKV